MREIIFKAKRVDGGEWVEGDLMRWNDGATRILHAEQYDTKCISNVDPETVCQFSGVLDKNKKKIFEGDSAKLKYHTAIYICTFAKDLCAFVWACEVTNEWRTMKEEAEIIGSIHDKKEGV